LSAQGGILTLSFSKWFRSLFRTGFAIVMLISAAWAQDAAQTAPLNTPAESPVAARPNPAGTSSSSGAMPQAAAAAQEPNAQESTTNDQGGMFVFKKEVEEVILHVNVFDDGRRLVPNLDRSAFTVLENGVPQPITSFRRQDVPVAMGIVVDNSGSMRDKRDEVNRAVLNLIRASNPQDEIFVVNFSQNSYLDQDFTSDVNLLQTALHQVSAAGSTALYDAVVASSVHLKNNPRLDKKVLLVITDGQDNMSQETLDEALRRLQQANGPTLYAVGLTGGGLQGQGRQALERLAQGTGGVAYFPATLDQVGDITQTVAHDIRSQYMISYRPKDQNAKPDDQSVRLEARAPGYGKLTVSTRSGYSYGGQSPAGKSVSHSSN
jgi:Ca-activated chloride channel family protein